MKPITKLYLKAFIFSGIPAVFVLWVTNLAVGIESSFWELLFVASIFGILLSLTLVSLHWYQLKKHGVEEITNENVGVNQTLKLRSELNRTDLVQKLKSDPITRKMEMTETENGIVLDSGMSWKSWGEEIKIQLTANNANNFDYLISSSPKLKTTLVDFGRNYEHVNRIKSVIKNIA